MLLEENPTIWVICLILKPLVFSCFFFITVVHDVAVFQSTQFVDVVLCQPMNQMK